MRVVIRSRTGVPVDQSTSETLKVTAAQCQGAMGAGRDGRDPPWRAERIPRLSASSRSASSCLPDGRSRPRRVCLDRRQGLRGRRSRASGRAERARLTMQAFSAGAAAEVSVETNGGRNTPYGSTIVACGTLEGTGSNDDVASPIAGRGRTLIVPVWPKSASLAMVCGME